MNQVAFYEFTRSGANGGMELAPWGDPVPVGKFPFMGKFTPDGKYYISTNLHWGADVADYLVGAPEGDLSVIRLSSVPSSVPAQRADGAEEEPPPSVVHQVVSTAQVGVSPEGLAISSDGAWIATANLRRSMLATSDPRVTLGGSVSLLSLDYAEGTLTNHGEWELPGMPEGLTFDSKSRHIVVTQFRSLDPNAVDGELAFFKVVPAMKGEGPKLVPGDFYVGVGTGPHGVVIVR